MLPLDGKKSAFTSVVLFFFHSLFFFVFFLNFFFSSNKHKCSFHQNNFCCVWIPLSVVPSISESASLQYHNPLWIAIPSRLPWQREMGNVFWASFSIFIFPLFLIFYRGSKWIIFILTCKCLGCALGWDLSIDYISERYGSAGFLISHMETAVLFLKKNKKDKVTVVLRAMKN